MLQMIKSAHFSAEIFAVMKNYKLLGLITVQVALVLYTFIMNEECP